MTTSAVRRGVAELALIVVGVLVAFGLEAWWSDRSEARATTESLRAITVEFEAADSVIAELEADHREMVGQFSALSRLLETGRLDLSEDSILRLSGSLWMYRNFDPAMPAYAEFLAEGGLANLDQENLGDALFRYELRLKANQDFDDYLRTSMVMSWEPILSSRIPFGDLAENTPEALRLMTAPELLAGDLEFRNLIEVRILVEEELLTRRESLRAVVRDVLRILASS